MSSTWKFNNREIDPAKLPTYDEVLSCILAHGGEDADHRLLTDWDFGPNGSGLTFHERSRDGDGGGYLLPVREGILSIPYGGWLNPDSHSLNLRHAELVTQEEAQDTMDYYLGYVGLEAPEAALWGEIAEIAGEMNLHDPED